MSDQPFSRPALALLAAGDGDAPQAARLSEQLALPLLATGSDPAACREFDAVLIVCGQALALQQTGRTLSGPCGEIDEKRGRGSPGRSMPGPVSVDFGSDGMRYRRRSGHNELLGKAVGIARARRPRILDATAGLGRDSFVLADMGCAVTLCERHPVIANLLSCGLQAALASGDDWLVQVVSRMRLIDTDARELSAQQLEDVAVIYLDPMFPPREKSAAVKKEMALFQLLLGGSADAAEADSLLQWALARDVARVVVKRPARAPFLAQRKPSHSVPGKAVRFDVYVRRALGG